MAATVRELAGLILDKQIRLGRPLRVAGLAEATAGPAFSTCAGLLAYGQRVDALPAPMPAAIKEGSSGLFGRIGHWLRDYL